MNPNKIYTLIPIFSGTFSVLFSQSFLGFFNDMLCQDSPDIWLSSKLEPDFFEQTKRIEFFEFLFEEATVEAKNLLFYEEACLIHLNHYLTDILLECRHLKKKSQDIILINKIEKIEKQAHQIQKSPYLTKVYALLTLCEDYFGLSSKKIEENFLLNTLHEKLSLLGHQAFLNHLLMLIIANHQEKIDSLVTLVNTPELHYKFMSPQHCLKSIQHHTCWFFLDLTTYVLLSKKKQSIKALIELIKNLDFMNLIDPILGHLEKYFEENISHDHEILNKNPRKNLRNTSIQEHAISPELSLAYLLIICHLEMGRLSFPATLLEQLYQQSVEIGIVFLQTLWIGTPYLSIIWDALSQSEIGKQFVLNTLHRTLTLQKENMESPFIKKWLNECRQKITDLSFSQIDLFAECLSKEDIIDPNSFFSFLLKNEDLLSKKWLIHIMEQLQRGLVYVNQSRNSHLCLSMMALHLQEIPLLNPYIKTMALHHDIIKNNLQHILKNILSLPVLSQKRGLILQSQTLSKRLYEELLEIFLKEPPEFSKLWINSPIQGKLVEAILLLLQYTIDAKKVLSILSHLFYFSQKSTLTQLAFAIGQSIQRNPDKNRFINRLNRMKDHPLLRIFTELIVSYTSQDAFLSKREETQMKKHPYFKVLASATLLMYAPQNESLFFILEESLTEYEKCPIQDPDPLIEFLKEKTLSSQLQLLKKPSPFSYQGLLYLLDEKEKLCTQPLAMQLDLIMGILKETTDLTSHHPEKFQSLLELLLTLLNPQESISEEDLTLLFACLHHVLFMTEQSPLLKELHPLILQIQSKMILIGYWHPQLIKPESDEKSKDIVLRNEQLSLFLTWAYHACSSLPNLSKENPYSLIQITLESHPVLLKNLSYSQPFSGMCVKIALASLLGHFKKIDSLNFKELVIMGILEEQLPLLKLGEKTLFSESLLAFLVALKKGWESGVSEPQIGILFFKTLSMEDQKEAVLMLQTDLTYLQKCIYLLFIPPYPYALNRNQVLFQLTALIQALPKNPKLRMTLYEWILTLQEKVQIDFEKLKKTLMDLQEQIKAYKPYQELVWQALGIVLLNPDPQPEDELILLFIHHLSQKMNLSLLKTQEEIAIKETMLLACQCLFDVCLVSKKPLPEIVLNTLAMQEVSLRFISTSSFFERIALLQILIPYHESQLLPAFLSKLDFWNVSDEKALCRLYLIYEKNFDIKIIQPSCRKPEIFNTLHTVIRHYLPEKGAHLKNEAHWETLEFASNPAEFDFNNFDQLIQTPTKMTQAYMKDSIGFCQYLHHLPEELFNKWQKTICHEEGFDFDIFIYTLWQNLSLKDNIQEEPSQDMAILWLKGIQNSGSLKKALLYAQDTHLISSLIESEKGRKMVIHSLMDNQEDPDYCMALLQEFCEEERRSLLTEVAQHCNLSVPLISHLLLFAFHPLKEDWTQGLLHHIKLSILEEQPLLYSRLLQSFYFRKIQEKAEFDLDTLIFFIKTLKCIPKSISRTEIQLLLPLFFNPEHEEFMSHFYQQAPFSFQKFCCLCASDLYHGIRKLRHIGFLIKAIQEMPLEMLYLFLKQYLYLDSSIQQLIEASQKNDIKQPPYSLIEKLKEKIPEDLIVRAAITSLSAPYRKSELSLMELAIRQKHTRHIPELELEFEKWNEFPEKQWQFLDRLRYLIADWKTESFQYLVKGWEYYTSIWDKLFQKESQNALHQNLIQFIEELAHTYLKDPKKDFILYSLHFLCFFLRYCPTYEEKLKKAFCESLAMYDIQELITIVPTILETPFLNEETKKRILSALLALKKDPLSAALLKQTSKTKWMWYGMTAFLAVCPEGLSKDLIFSPKGETHEVIRTWVKTELENTDSTPLLLEFFTALDEESRYEFGKILATLSPQIKDLKRLLMTALNEEKHSFTHIFCIYLAEVWQTSAAMWIHNLLLDITRISPEWFTDLNLFGYLLEKGHIDSQGLICIEAYQNVSLGIKHDSELERRRIEKQVNKTLHQHLVCRKRLIQALTVHCPHILLEESGYLREGHTFFQTPSPLLHYLCELPGLSKGVFHLLQECFLSLFYHNEYTRTTLSKWVKTLPFLKIMGFIQEKYFSSKTRYILLESWISEFERHVSEEHRPLWKTQMIKSCLHHLLSKKDYGNEIILMLFSQNPSLFQQVCKPYFIQIEETFNLDMSLLISDYQVIKHQLKTSASHVSEIVNQLIKECPKAFGLLSLCVAAHALSDSYPSFYKKFYITLKQHLLQLKKKHPKWKSVLLTLIALPSSPETIQLTLNWIELEGIMLNAKLIDIDNAIQAITTVNLSALNKKEVVADIRYLLAETAFDLSDIETFLLPFPIKIIQKDLDKFFQNPKEAELLYKILLQSKILNEEGLCHSSPDFKKLSIHLSIKKKTKLCEHLQKILSYKKQLIRTVLGFHVGFYLLTEHQNLEGFYFLLNELTQEYTWRLLKEFLTQLSLYDQFLFKKICQDYHYFDTFSKEDLQEVYVNFIYKKERKEKKIKEIFEEYDDKKIQNIQSLSSLLETLSSFIASTR